MFTKEPYEKFSVQEKNHWNSFYYSGQMGFNKPPFRQTSERKSVYRIYRGSPLSNVPRTLFVDDDRFIHTYDHTYTV